jgi:hypothetical protein
MKSKDIFLKKSWFWLMMIFVVLVGLFILQLYENDLIPAFIKDVIRSDCFWTAVGSIGTLISVIVASKSLIVGEQNRKRQATYDAFSTFKDSVLKDEEKIALLDIEQVIENHKNNNQKDWVIIKKYLTKIERIATCVNSGIFDYETIYNMGGPYLIKQFDILYPIICYKRNEEQRSSIYKEFEVMVLKLKYIYENRRT